MCWEFLLKCRWKGNPLISWLSHRMKIRFRSSDIYLAQNFLGKAALSPSNFMSMCVCIILWHLEDLRNCANNFICIISLSPYNSLRQVLVISTFHRWGKLTLKLKQLLSVNYCWSIYQKKVYRISCYGRSKDIGGLQENRWWTYGNFNTKQKCREWHAVVYNDLPSECLVLSAIHLRHESMIHKTMSSLWSEVALEKETFELGFEEWVGFPLVEGWMEKLFYAKGLACAKI